MRLAGLCIAALASLVPGLARAQDAVAQFYKGKQISIVVGTAAGGGYDAYARFIARHFGDHIPGNPSVIVSNMPGAGSNLAAYHVAVTAPKDGTVIGAIFAGALLEPLIGTTTVRHDPNRFQLLGSANDDVYVCLARKDADVKTFAQAIQRPSLPPGSGGTSVCLIRQSPRGSLDRPHHQIAFLVPRGFADLPRRLLGCACPRGCEAASSHARAAAPGGGCAPENGPESQ